MKCLPGYEDLSLPPPHLKIYGKAFLLKSVIKYELQYGGGQTDSQECASSGHF